MYWSPSTGDLLVGMYKYKSNSISCVVFRSYMNVTGKVTRFSQSGQLAQTIQHDNTGMLLYNEPNYITENNNGDIVVSDRRSSSGAVVVTEREGRYRFSYTGHPSGSELMPRGICTDSLLHILVCDGITNTVQMISKDGQFLSYLLKESQDVGAPRSMGYDVNTMCLWVGFQYKLCLYRYNTRQDALTGKSEFSFIIIIYII